MRLKVNRIVQRVAETSPWFSAFVGGTLLVSFFKACLTEANKAEPSTKILAVSYVLLSFGLLIYLGQKVSKEVDRSRISVRFYYRNSAKDSDADIYEAIVTSLRKAKKSLYVLGSLRLPAADGTEARRRYFEEIERLLKTKSERGDLFEYERIIQLQPRAGEVLRSVDVGNATRLLKENVDSVLYEHCKRVRSLSRLHGRVQVRLLQAPPVMPMITLILVDEDTVVLCLPWLERGASLSLNTEQLGKGLFFRDRGDELAAEMKAFFNVARHSSIPISSVEGEDAAEVDLGGGSGKSAGSDSAASAGKPS